MKVTRITDEGGDWEALYVDGKLKAQNHSLMTREVLEALGIEEDHREMNLEEWGHCPPRLEQILPPEPRRIKLYLHSDKESAREAARTAGFTDEEIDDWSLNYLGYEVELDYEVDEQGSAKIVAVNGRSYIDGD